MPTQRKDEIVNAALRRAGVASPGMLIEPEPESIEATLWDLEHMIAAWQAEGLAISFLFTREPTAKPQPSEFSGLPAWAVEAVVNNLALRVCNDNRLPIADNLLTEAYNGKYQIAAQRTVVPSLVRRNDMPRGAGNAGRRFYTEPADPFRDENGQIVDI